MFTQVRLKQKDVSKPISDVKLIEAVMKKVDSYASRFTQGCTLKETYNLMQDIAATISNFNLEAYAFVKTIALKIQDEQIQAILDNILTNVDTQDDEAIVRSVGMCYAKLNRTDTDLELLEFKVLKQKPNQSLQSYYSYVCQKFLSLKCLGVKVANDSLVHVLCNLQNALEKIQAEKEVVNGETYIFDLIAKGILKKNDAAHSNNTRERTSSTKSTFKQAQKKEHEKQDACWFCGSKTCEKKTKCWARDKECNYCKVVGHIEKVCHKKARDQKSKTSN